MRPNVGMLDAAFRLILGLAILSLLVVGPKTWWALLGIIPIATAVVGTCPLYTVFGITTCSHADRGHRPT